MGRFFLFYGGSSIELLEGETIVGRHPVCRIRIHAPWVSRQHARFSVAGPELWIEDLGSRNGTRLNGDNLTRPARAEVGDEVALGSHRVTIVVHDEDLLEPDTAVVEPFAAARDEGLAGFAETRRASPRRSSVPSSRPAAVASAGATPGTASSSRFATRATPSRSTRFQ